MLFCLYIYMKEKVLYVLLFLAIALSLFFTYQRSFVWKNFELINSEEGMEEAESSEETSEEELIVEEELLIEATTTEEMLLPDEG
jgi:hypothetical protein